mmetsp:Transcript_82099/g.222968  ORF Transcript_82099/g.222968 Transcript_82099/m.222968 type:complete len:201 (-) Transcript_82099:454-1056(-)
MGGSPLAAAVAEDSADAKESTAGTGEHPTAEAEEAAVDAPPQEAGGVGGAWAKPAAGAAMPWPSALPKCSRRSSATTAPLDRRGAGALQPPVPVVRGGVENAAESSTLARALLALPGCQDERGVAAGAWCRVRSMDQNSDEEAPPGVGSAKLCMSSPRASEGEVETADGDAGKCLPPSLVPGPPASDGSSPSAAAPVEEG